MFNKLLKDIAQNKLKFHSKSISIFKDENECKSKYKNDIFNAINCISYAILISPHNQFLIWSQLSWLITNKQLWCKTKVEYLKIVLKIISNTPSWDTNKYKTKML